jgi:hypothetical protein
MCRLPSEGHIAQLSGMLRQAHKNSNLCDADLAAYLRTLQRSACSTLASVLLEGNGDAGDGCTRN